MIVPPRFIIITENIIDLDIIIAYHGAFRCIPVLFCMVFVIFDPETAVITSYYSYNYYNYKLQ
jgi:hypothetical protein